MASSPFNLFGDADLHGLVDGHIEPDRRTDALRRLAGSPEDRARVESWQKQNDVLRTAFAGVDREPLPVMLDLKARPRLHCVPADESLRPGAVRGEPRPRRRRVGFAVATILLVAAGIAGTWMFMDLAETDDPTAKLRGSVDAMLAGRSAEAIGRGASAVARTDDDVAMPMIRIPDLRKAGFSFTGAEFDTSEPASILFRYQGGAAERLVVSAARAPAQDGVDSAPVRIGDAYTWHRRDVVFAIAGTPPSARLRALAAALQSAAGD